MQKKLLLVFFLISSFLLIYGCDSENRAHKLPLTLDITGKNICLYTNSKSSFLDGNDKEAYYFLVWIKSLNLGMDANSNIYDRKIMLKDHVFPFEKSDCILVPLNLLEVNRPYDFIIHTDKSFSTRACILRNGENYQIKKVHSTENCNS